jgi:chemotaxis response regulator CheB
MPGAVVNAGLAHRVLPIQEIAPELIRQASAAARGRAEVHEVVA